MEFRFIDDGTKLDIQRKSAPDEATYYGTFEKLDKGVTFFLSCDVLYEQHTQIDPAELFIFTFFRGAEYFTFEGRMGETARLGFVNAISVTATTLISRFSRRSTHRIRVRSNVNIHALDPANENQPGALLCTGLIHDISRGGLTFLSNEKIPLDLRHSYLAVFTVNHLTYHLPVEYVRGSERAISPHYRYDYAFMFNGDDLTEELNKMTLGLFEQQIKAER